MTNCSMARPSTRYEKLIIATAVFQSSATSTRREPTARTCMFLPAKSPSLCMIVRGARSQMSTYPAPPRLDPIELLQNPTDRCLQSDTIRNARPVRPTG